MPKFIRKSLLLALLWLIPVFHSRPPSVLLHLLNQSLLGSRPIRAFLLPQVIRRSVTQTLRLSVSQSLCRSSNQFRFNAVAQSLR